jgi:hypothetical protein
MNKQTVTGIHVFEKRNDDGWTEMSFAVQLLSIISWKKFYGRIELYTNEEHLEDLKLRGIDKLYDKIDTELLKTMPELDKKKYWAFGKMYVASKLEPPFVLVDTDLWFDYPVVFNEDLSYQAYHFESFDINYSENIYLDFENNIPLKWIGRWNKDLMPTNTAILRINDKDLLKEWYECALEVAQQENQIIVDEEVHSYYMTFVEQRLLPMIAHEMGKPYKVILPSIYKSYVRDGRGRGEEWEPMISELSENDRTKFMSTRHVWGMKSFIPHNEGLKNIVSHVLHYSFDLFNGETAKYRNLLEVWK